MDIQNSLDFSYANVKLKNPINDHNKLREEVLCLSMVS